MCRLACKGDCSALTGADVFITVPKSAKNDSRRRPANRRVLNPRRSLVPPSFQADLTYYDFYSLASGGAASHVSKPFRANNPRDPQFDVGGGSCTGYTRLASLYERYRVTAVTAEFSGYNTCATPLIVGIRFRAPNGLELTTGAGCQQALMEMPSQNVHTTVVPYTAGMSWPPFSVRSTRTMSGILGHDADDQNYTAVVTSDPTLELYLDFIIVAADGVAVSITASSHVRVTYHVTFSEPNQTYDD